MVVKTHWQITASIWLLAAIMFVCTSAATMAAWWLWGPSEQPFRYVYHDRDAAVVSNGAIELRRTLEVSRRVELYVTRDLVQRNGSFLTRVALPSSRAVYEPGEYTLNRLLEIPHGARSGVYEMENVVHWKINPLREGHLQLPPIKVVIP